MSVFEKLVRAHSPLGIYSIKENSNIACELGAYGAGLELLQDELREMEREAFFMTAEDYGLSMWEKLWGAARTDLSAEERREMLVARLSFGYGDFTPEGMNKVLRFLGVEGVIKEYPHVHRVTVEFPSKSLSFGQRNFIAAQLKSVFPAHIEADAVFAGFDWNGIDSRDLTFDSMEQRGMRWSDIDIFVM